MIKVVNHLNRTYVLTEYTDVSLSIKGKEEIKT